MEEQYRKLAVEFRDFIGKLPKSRKQRDELSLLLAEVPREYAVGTGLLMPI